MAVTEMAPAETTTRERRFGTFSTLTCALTWGIAAVFVVAPDLAGRAGGGSLDDAGDK